MPKVQTKSRKSHTKSRRGCSACKERHQKCDETLPSCINCVTARRRCPYLDERSRSESHSSSNEPNVQSERNTVTSREQSEDTIPIQLQLHGVPKDLLYIELLQQWLSHTYQTCVGPRRRADAFSIIAFNHALNSPFLMRSMLAVAALHKASTTSGLEQDNYLAASDQLQAEGLTRFNSIVSNLTTETIVPAFLFAFVTGVHRLCRASNQAHRGNDFLAALIEAMAFVRGVQAIITGWWPYIQASELRVLIPDSRPSTEVSVARHDAQPTAGLRKLIESIVTEPDTFQMYDTVIKGLEAPYENFDNLIASEADPSIGFVVVWMITIPGEFVQHLKEGRPEALVILAHAAPLLHYRRSCWGVRDAGRVLVDTINSRLSESWRTWLEWPKQVISST